MTVPKLGKQVQDNNMRKPTSFEPTLLVQLEKFCLFIYLVEQTYVHPKSWPVHTMVHRAA